MNPDLVQTCTAFLGYDCIARGSTEQVATALKEKLAENPNQTFLVFDDSTSQQVELDLRTSSEQVRQHYQPHTHDADSSPEKPSRGRPKLGVIAKEITLLPRHWDWLASQSGGASATLRRLVEKARKEHEVSDQKRRAQEVIYKFMSVMAGNLPHYEEALRALYKGQKTQFFDLIQPWPEDVREHIKQLARAAFPT